MKRLPILLFAVSAVIFSCDKKQSEEKNAEKTDTIKTEEKTRKTCGKDKEKSEV